MSKSIAALFAGLFAAVLAVGASAADDGKAPESMPAATAPAAGVPDSEQLEKQLQDLNWRQFRSVITAIPKLKADVDAYGPMGWQYVQANYKTYHWRKSIKKLDDTQKVQLAQLIQKSKNRTGSLN